MSNFAVLNGQHTRICVNAAVLTTKIGVGFLRKMDGNRTLALRWLAESLNAVCFAAGLSSSGEKSSVHD